MKYLELMFEKLRSDGYVYCAPGSVTGKIIWEETLPSDYEWDLFSKCEPFVFTPEEAFDRTKDAQTAAMTWVKGFDHNSEIDAPFPVFSVEYLDGSPLDFFVMDSGQKRFTLAIIVIEIKPKEYGYYALCKDENGRNIVFKSNTEGETVKALLERLSHEKMGIQKVRQIVKIGTGDSKRTHRIRKVVHVCPKKSIETYGGSRNVDWSHRWEVRGHWRKHEGLGKDRDGNYSVNGFTWVINYEKGPEDLPLVKKTRFVKEGA